MIVNKEIMEIIKGNIYSIKKEEIYGNGTYCTGNVTYTITLLAIILSKRRFIERRVGEKEK